MALEHPDISKLQETIYKDITRFSNEFDSRGLTFQDILEQRALKKALATTMMYYVKFAYELGKRQPDFNPPAYNFDKALDKVLDDGNDPIGLQDIIDSL